MPYADKAKQREFQRNWMRENKKTWITSMGGKCAACGSPEKLEVDHIDRSTKVTHAVWSWTPKKREAELAKCQLLCSTCHKAKTSKELSKPEEHGTERQYRKGCRCQLCSKEKTRLVNEWRWRTGRRKKQLP